MSAIDLLLLAFALAMDAMAVTISNSLCFPHTPIRRRIGMALTFGFFQFLMPVLGYLSVKFVVYIVPQSLVGASHSLPELMSTYSGFLALILLGFIGIQMLIDAVQEMRSSLECPAHHEVLSVRALLAQAVATSIDAFAVGVTFASLSADIAWCSSVIGVMTAALCFGAMGIASRLGVMFGAKAKLLGGLVLIAIGIKAVL